MLFTSHGSQANALKIGQLAPNFSLPDQNGKIHTLQSFRRKWLALYFYPRDDTPGCTEQACKFRDDLKQLEDLGANIIGISVDNTTSHAKFAKKYNLPFPLLADNNAETAIQYNSLINLMVIKLAKRNTFLIDPNGKIAKIYLSASTSHNSAEIIKDLKKLQNL
ncbi:MAG: peroxiredoxin [Nitrosomonadaceae bacterium]|nr:peroxiredoxin [Nitrosomonadaceae bacterium]|tara:strand:+ start:222 stop:713 length:492 start_codon:yes stop_codon:yes gene_type:complete